jgi:hypothetical protein
MDLNEFEAIHVFFAYGNSNISIFRNFKSLFVVIGFKYAFKSHRIPFVDFSKTRIPLK